MPKIEFYLLDLRRAEINNQQAVLLFGRTRENTRVCVIDTSFLPFFYVIPRNSEVKGKLENLEVEMDGKRARVIKAENVSKNICGKKKDAIKVYVPLYYDIRIIRSVIEEWETIEGIYEHDIPYLRKYLAYMRILPSSLITADADEFNAGHKVRTYLARSITSSQDCISSPRILAFDIETYNPEGRKIDMQKNPIIMLSFYGEGLKKVFTWKRFNTDLEYIEFVNSESEIIEKFIQTVEHYQPDIITGYNTDYFDFPYIVTRARKYKLPLTIGLNNSTVRLARKNPRARIPGIVHIDTYRFAKTMQIEGKLSLANVAKKLLGEQKKELELMDLFKVWDSGSDAIAEYCQYNLVDSKLAYDLCMKFLPNILELAKLTGLTLDNITRLGYSQIVESFLIRKAIQLDELAPNKPDKDEIATRFLNSYKGSYVFEPVPGVYDDIVVFDFRSLYPSIISSHNISPDTMDCTCCDEGTNLPPGQDTGHHFCAKKKGFLAMILEELIAKRIEIKQGNDVLRKARRETLKLLANSFYGYLGFYAARWYSIEAANTITAWGRYYIQQVIKKAKENDFFVIYSDTDSIFIALGDKKEEEALVFLQQVNDSLPGIMELEFEGFYNRGIFVSSKDRAAGAKKKYALLTKDGEIRIRGFETVRRNASVIVRELQRNILEMLLKEESPKEALSYFRYVVREIKERRTTNKDTIISTILQKSIESYDHSAPHVVVAKKLQQKGVKITPGIRIDYIVAEGEGKISERARLPEEVEEGKYDAEYYINNQLIPAVEKIFELFGYNKESLLEPKNQTKLDEF